MDDKLFDEESQRLLRAFFSVRDRTVRKAIVKLVEEMADSSQIDVEMPDDHLRVSRN